MGDDWTNALQAESVTVTPSGGVVETDVEQALYGLDTRTTALEGDTVGVIRTVNLAAATQDLTKAQSGEKFVGAVDAIFTLPAAAGAGMAGCWFEFECGALSTGTGLSISPAAADAIGGNGLGVTVNKDLINSGATDRLGDCVRIYCTGVTGATAWRIENIIGTWAKEG